MTHPISSAPMGVLPNQAIWCSAITLPCMEGSVACCTTMVFTDWNDAEVKPTTMLIATNHQ
jgi:hypothetical protein